MYSHPRVPVINDQLHQRSRAVSATYNQHCLLLPPISMVSLSTAILALGLTAAVDARALSKKGMKWNSCSELNKNITELTATLLLGAAEPFECSKLSVPLDYTDPDSPPLNLDLFRVKATKEPVLGTVLYNPGGPGGNAGVNLPAVASDLRASVGEQYHLLSWDPRGTGYTIPFVCSATEDETAAPSRKRDIQTLSTYNMTDFFLNGGWDANGEYAEACQASTNETTGSLIGTAFLARDMLEIVDSLGEDGLLRYYGHSYGTVLGSYFAVMFPDRVERMILDANIDPGDYRDGTYGDNIIDTDKTFYAFLEACFANKDECALATFVNANSTGDLFDVMDLYVAQLAAKVVDVETFELYAPFKQAILQGLYFPSQWPAMAETIVTFLSTSTDDASTEAEADADAESESETKREATPWSYGSDAGAGIGIRGSDATFKPTSAKEYLPTLENQINVSSFADVWYSSAWISAQWKMPAKERFYGEFTAKTKHPILYVNGEYDPVTPLVHARRASKGFEGSVVLSHSGFGHGVFADPSNCVHEYTRAFFKDGVLPEEGTYCEPDLGPWELAKIRNGTAYGALQSLESDGYFV